MLFDTYTGAMMNITAENVVDGFNDEMSDNNLKMGTLFGVLAPILVVVVMFIILLFSFYNFHRRLHLKKKHHIDYIRANLPLKRPRISPPTMNTFRALDWKRGSAGNESYSGYVCVPKEDISEHETENRKAKGSNNETETKVNSDKCERTSSRVKRSSSARWKYGDKFEKYRFELVPTLCQPESDYLPGDELVSIQC